MKKLLLVVKQSSRSMVPAEWARRFASKGVPPWVRPDMRRQRQARESHERSLAGVLRALARNGLSHKIIHRASQVDFSRFGPVIAVGGDGTFLEAARAVGKGQLLIGVNSDPERSIGSFCACTVAGFPRVLKKLLAGRLRICRLSRFRLLLNGQAVGPPVLNDVLATHSKPAATSRYWIKIGEIQEEQRSSGVWIATAAGSTGAIRSAGGRRLARSSRQLQYRPRELCRIKGQEFRLRGGVVPAGRGIEIGSLMREGLVCLDGEHVTFPFSYGDRLRVVSSDVPLLTVAPESARRVSHRGEEDG